MNHREINQLIPLAVVGVFFSMPLMCLLMIITALNEFVDEEDFRPRYYLYFLLALLPAMINTTKPTAGSDLGYYYWLYEFAGTKTFAEYLALIPKEPFYHIYNYIARILTFGDFRLFVVVTSLLMYLPVIFAFDIIVRKHELDSRVAIYASVILLLFPQYFIYTMQIVRQVLAGSIAFYCVVKSVYDNSKMATIGVFCAGFIHASAFLFCIYYAFLWTKGWGLKSKLLLLAICGVSFYTLLETFSSLGMENSTLTYAARRGMAENTEIINVGLFPRLISLSILPIGLLSALKLQDDRFNTFISASWIIAGFIILKWNTPLFVLRYMEYAYMFLPICVALFLVVYNKFRLLPLVAVIMSAYFILSLFASNFTYIPLIEIALRGAIFYFI